MGRFFHEYGVIMEGVVEDPMVINSSPLRSGDHSNLPEVVTLKTPRGSLIVFIRRDVPPGAKEGVVGKFFRPY
jgi:hypothetical protein